MIFRRYGTTYQSVDMEFTAEALNEIGFRRNRETSIPVDDLETRYEPVETVELTAQAQGVVQNEAEQQLLNALAAKVREQLDRLEDGGILVVENESGRDYPRTHQETKNVVERGENRMHFSYSVDPALRVALYRPRS
ncbi:MAG: hypothetical protein HKN72_09825 [Gemmatimonadetes bacterium]|nr:hypothetical protein [Gemmatimonadota bacterium]NNL29695.1 hypothetical protein [Gemmatimonadota bacterium]